VSRGQIVSQDTLPWSYGSRAQEKLIAFRMAALYKPSFDQSLLGDPQ